jgi:hypothetical protein
MANEATFTDQLEGWLRGDGPKTLGGLGEVFAEKAFATTILLLMFVPALPLPTGGITHLFEAIVVVVAAQMVLGRRTLWLPQRWKARPLGELTKDRAIPFMVRMLRRFERISRPRGTVLLRARTTHRLLGLLLMAFAIGAALAPPFSGLDTLPALGAVVVALAIILEDVVVLAIGVAIGAGGIALILTVGALVVRFVRDLV